MQTPPHAETQITVEICVDAIDLALAAARGGADRLELCGPLLDGGISPSAGLVKTVRRSVSIPIAMLIRPRTGAFTASNTEYEVMRQEILFARDSGMDMVVLGLLHEDRTIDVERTHSLVEMAYPLPVTFHRAFEATSDLEQSLEAVLQTGASRILTSGGQSNAAIGAAAVGRLQQIAGDRISLMLCGGLTPPMVRQVLPVSGVHELHAALRKSIQFDPMAGGITRESLVGFEQAVSLLKAETLPRASIG